MSISRAMSSILLLGDLNMLWGPVGYVLSRACPGSSYKLDVPGKPPQGGFQKAPQLFSSELLLDVWAPLPDPKGHPARVTYSNAFIFNLFFSFAIYPKVMNIRVVDRLVYQDQRPETPQNCGWAQHPLKKLLTSWWGRSHSSHFGYPRTEWPLSMLLQYPLPDMLEDMVTSLF